MSTAAAVNDFVMEAMRKTVLALGAGPPTVAAPKPPEWTSTPSCTTPNAMPGTDASSGALENTSSAIAPTSAVKRHAPSRA